MHTHNLLFLYVNNPYKWIQQKLIGLHLLLDNEGTLQLQIAQRLNY